MGTGEYNAGDNAAMDKHPEKSRNTPSSGFFMLQKPEISAGLMGHLAHI